MDGTKILAALSGLESRIEEARDAKMQVESEFTGARIEGGVYEWPQDALGSKLNDLFDILVVLLEVAGLPATRNRLIEKWAEFEKEGGVRKTIYLEQFDLLESKPFEYLERLVEGLRISAGDGVPSNESYELAKLEMLLRKTPVLLRKRKVIPKKEQDVQGVMHDYLGAFFTEYKKDFRIPGIIRDFKPDGGVRSLKVAIEFKYVATQTEAARAMSGIFEDISGYTGSLDWIRYYSVIYQTEAFESEDRVRSELKRAGAFTWKPILVTGAGSRRPRKASALLQAKVDP